MKAQLLKSFGSADEFQLTEFADPVAGPGEVLVRVVATSVNPADYKIRSSGPPIAPDLPAVLGMDVAGVIEAVGPGIQDWSIGEAIYGCAGGVRGVGGAYAELMTVDPALIARKPASLSFGESAALPLVTITAWEGLERAGLKAGDHVLVHGGAGGVGHVAIQLAKAWGARVAASVSSVEKAKAAQALGADEMVLYREEQVEAYVQRLTAGRGFDVVFDATGGDDLARSFQAARLNGQVVTIVSQYQADLSLMHARGLSLHVVFMLIPMLHGIGRDQHGQILKQAAALVDSGQIRPLLDSRRFNLAELPSAHRRLEDGKATGKVIVQIDPRLANKNSISANEKALS